MVSPSRAADSSDELQANQANIRETFSNYKNYPPYLPLPSDAYSKPEDGVENAEAPGTWGIGRVTWTPTAHVTGVRQVVDRYSITRYSPKDWRKKNQEVLNLNYDTSHLKGNVQRTVDTATVEADNYYTRNTQLLEERVKEVRDCQMEMEALVKDFREEIVFLINLKVKLKFALPNLKKPELIAGECIDRRTNRLEADLVNDEVEIQLTRELSLVKETRDSFLAIIEEVERQIQANKVWKDQLEESWSDKKETCELESINACLKNTTPIIDYHGGAARIPENQSSPESWAVFNATLLKSAKEEYCKSVKLRDSTDNIIENAVCSLRTQADKVYVALKRRIEEMDLCRQRFEKELQENLAKIVDAEALYKDLFDLQRQLEYSTKVVETRLNNRLQRSRIENCRDEAQRGLLDEVQYLSKAKKDLQHRIDDIDGVLIKLYEMRKNLEHAILTKRKSLYIDQERVMAYREKYPDANTLGGGNA